VARGARRWEEFFTDAGVPYYFNAETGETLWQARRR